MQPRNIFFLYGYYTVSGLNNNNKNEMYEVYGQHVLYEDNSRCCLPPCIAFTAVVVQCKVPAFLEEEEREQFTASAAEVWAFTPGGSAGGGDSRDGG